MGFRSFNTGLIIRIFLLLAVIFAGGSVLVLSFERDLFFIPLVLILLLVLQVFEFVIFVRRINRALTTMLETLKSDDYTMGFSARTGTPLKGLYTTFNEVTDYIRRLKVEKEAQYEYLRNVVGHIHIGIISLKEDQVEFINRPAVELLEVEEPAGWKDLASSVPWFTSEIESIKGRGSRLIEYKMGDAVKRLSVKVSTLVVLSEELRVITLQDIRSEIEQKEAEAWQKLIRILRHEIMNSVTPISSMTETVLMLVEDHLGASRKASALSDEDVSDIRDSLVTIYDRSEGLNHFLEQYREITRIPEVRKERIQVSDLVDRSIRLLETAFSSKGIDVIADHEDPGSEIIADPGLVEQVLINILRNSIEALAHTDGKDIKESKDRIGPGEKQIEYDERYIKIVTSKDLHSQVISITDNGCGIREEDLDEIFVPFYSTKAEGSGIGLSISRQIMHLHGGDIVATSDPGKRTTFSLIFYQ